MPINYKEEEQQITRLIDNIATTIIYSSEAFANFYAYSFVEYPGDMKKDLTREPLKFHKLCFQYFLILQFCKLSEDYNTLSKGDSSLKKLNALLHTKYPVFENNFKLNSQLIKEITKSKVFKSILKLRNSSYAHTDNKPINLPLRFKFLKQTETDSLKDLLLKAIDIYNNCTGLYGYNTSFHNLYDSSTPRNYLKAYFRNQKMFRDNAEAKKIDLG